MPTPEKIDSAWQQCREWFTTNDGKTSEITILDIPESGLEPVLDAVRDRAKIVAVLGKDGPELFANLDWMDSEDEDLIWSTFFMVVLDELRLQHSLGPSRPTKPGPWMAVGGGTYDLEIALWPDEVFSGVVAADRALFGKVLDYVDDLREACGGQRLCITHGCYDNPRTLIDGADPDRSDPLNHLVLD